MSSSDDDDDNTSGAAAAPVEPLNSTEADMARQAGMTPDEFRATYQSDTRLEDDEWVDRVEIKVYPRFKTSELSGNQWRQTVGVSAFRKGVLIGFMGRSSFDEATREIATFVKGCYGSTFCAFPGVHGMSRDDPSLVASKEAGRNRMRKLCMHIGCDKPAVNLHRVTQDGCTRCGHARELSRNEPYTRRFCAEHNNRGTQGLSDSNRSLELIAGAKAGTSSVDPRLVSEAVFGGVVTMNMDAPYAAAP